MATLFTKRHVGVFIGRFQPFHNGHMAIIEDAFNVGIKRLRIFIGSANQQRTLRNPFTYQERLEMIVETLRERFSSYDIRCTRMKAPFDQDVEMATVGCEELGYINIYPLNDYMYNEAMWTTDVLKSTYAHIHDGDKVILLGYKKDMSSYYLDIFPEFDTHFVTEPAESAGKIMNATDFRKIFFMAPDEATAINAMEGVMPAPAGRILVSFMRSDTYTDLVEEYKYIYQYKKSWEKAPYPPIFVTADALVQQGNRILLIRRKHVPGKGLWALPGGFVNPEEPIKEGMLRELREETGVELPYKVLNGSIVSTTVVDTPGRSERGRTITHVFHIKLDAKAGALPKVSGNSDASDARWFRFDEVSSMKHLMFEDHGDIINKVLGI